jgi:MFS family permease
MNQPSPEAAGQPHVPRNVKVLGAASLLNDIAGEMVFPLLPRFLLSLGGNLFFLGLIDGTADSVASLLKLWSGGRTDQAGRRKGFVVFGYSLGAVTRPLLGILMLPWQILAIRVADRIGKGVRTAPRDALIADSTDPRARGRAFGLHRAMDHVGAAVGPLLAAGFLEIWPGQWRTLFLLSIVPGMAVVVLLVFFLKEAPAAVPPKDPIQLTLRPFGRPFRLYLVALVVFTLGNSSDSFLIARASELGMPIKESLLLWCVFSIVKANGNLLFGRAVDRFGPRRFLLVGWFVYAGVYLAFGLASTVWQVVGCFLVYALFYSLTEPAEKTLVAILAGPENKGLAYGWFHCAIGIAVLPANLIFGAIYESFGALAAFGWGAVLALIATVLLGSIAVTPDKA